MTLPDGIQDEIDEIFVNYSRGRDTAIPSDPRAPGMAYGIMVDQELVYAGGCGRLIVGDPRVPKATDIFRIASMTKSFTAAAILLLRDRGRLEIDQPIRKHLPELGRIVAATDDGPPIRIRELLSMNAGLPEDDPWADRLQDLSEQGFDALLQSGISAGWTAGTAFEYSNLGYALLGRIITRVSGMPFSQFITSQLLEPLGMESSVWQAAGVPDDRLASGYVWRDGAWLAEPLAGHGVFGAMGGLFSSVTDIARWIIGFCAAYPPRSGNDDHPLGRASRRELQRPHTLRPRQLALRTDGYCMPRSEAYGFGVSVSDDAEFGVTISHAGGYPGFGSFMVWQPSTGSGVVALANGRYAYPKQPAYQALATVLRRATPSPHRVGPRSDFAAIRASIVDLLREWNEDTVARLFAPNLAMDLPLARRKQYMLTLNQRYGPMLDTEEIRVFSPTHASWWLAGRGARINVTMMLTPEIPGRIQKLQFTVVETGIEFYEVVGRAVWDAWHRPGDAAALESLFADCSRFRDFVGPFSHAAALLGCAAAIRVIAACASGSAVFEITAQSGILNVIVEADVEGRRIRAAALDLPQRAALPW